MGMPEVRHQKSIPQALSEHNQTSRSGFRPCSSCKISHGIPRGAPASDSALLPAELSTSQPIWFGRATASTALC